MVPKMFEPLKFDCMFVSVYVSSVYVLSKTGGKKEYIYRLSTSEENTTAYVGRVGVKLILLLEKVQNGCWARIEVPGSLSAAAANQLH